MHQLLYISTARQRPDAGMPIDPASILASSRANNARAGITGLLFYDGRRFLQVLEGDEDAIQAVMARIREDPRHHAIVVLSSRVIAEREFGDWSMAYQRRDEDAAETIARVAGMAEQAGPAVQGTFIGLAEMRRAA